MATLKVTVTAVIPLPEGAVAQAEKTLAVSKGMESIAAALESVGATNVSERLDFGRERKKRAKVASD